MADNQCAGTIAGLWRFPVKSMRGERLGEAEVTERGVVGDRAYALIDTETGRVVSAKSVKRFPDLFGCSAAFVEPPRRGADIPAAQITLANGTSIASDAADVDDVLSAFFERDVTLARVAPEDYAIDQFQPDLEAADSGGGGIVVAQKLGSALFAELGMESPVPVGAFFDAFPLSLLTTSTLEKLNALRPASRFDERRFRMNVIVAAERSGFVENDWVGRQLRLGGSVRLRVAMPDPRCVMTTLAQDDLPRDIEVLRTLVQHNRIPLGDLGELPCAGVYAVSEMPGVVRVGDTVVVA